MILPETLKEYAPGKIRYFPPNTCTLEHPVTRLEPEKRKKSRAWLTILCKKCNEEKGREEEIRLGEEAIKERAAH